MKERKHDIENNSTVHKMLLHIKKTKSFQQHDCLKIFKFKLKKEEKSEKIKENFDTSKVQNKIIHRRTYVYERITGDIGIGDEK